MTAARNKKIKWGWGYRNGSVNNVLALSALEPEFPEPMFKNNKT